MGVDEVGAGGHHERLRRIPAKRLRPADGDFWRVDFAPSRRLTVCRPAWHPPITVRGARLEAGVTDDDDAVHFDLDHLEFRDLLVETFPHPLQSVVLPVMALRDGVVNLRGTAFSVGRNLALTATHVVEQEASPYRTGRLQRRKSA